MKRIKTTQVSVLVLALSIAPGLFGQMEGDEAYMIGDYVEIGINANGYEGAPCQAYTHCRDIGPDWLGFVANPQEDGWVEYNGDFYSPGAFENGFGLTYTFGGTTYTRSNNAMGGTGDIAGSITSYVDSGDTITVIWVGNADDLELTITYELDKDAHYYNTTMEIANTGATTYSDVYYYRNVDPDNNQLLGAGFTTDNIIESQSEMADDSVRVIASQTTPWLSELIFNAYGPDWKGYMGGFSNRNGSDAWNGTGALTTIEGTSTHADQAIGLAYKIASLPPGKATSDAFGFSTSFKRGAINGDTGGDTGSLNNNNTVNFEMYPNPLKDDLLVIDIDGDFTYQITDIKGALILQGSGNNVTSLDLQEIKGGIYFMTLIQESETGIQRLIIE